MFDSRCCTTFGFIVARGNIGFSTLIPTDEKLQARHTCFAPFEMMALLLKKDLNPRVAFSLVYLWLKSQELLEACKPLAIVITIFNTYYKSNVGNDVPGSGLSVPGKLFQQEIDLELYMEQMVLHWDLTGLQSLTAKMTPNAVVASLTLTIEVLKDSQLHGKNGNARQETYLTMMVQEAFRESNARHLLALCKV